MSGYVCLLVHIVPLHCQLKNAAHTLIGIFMSFCVEMCVCAASSFHIFLHSTTVIPLRIFSLLSNRNCNTNIRVGMRLTYYVSDPCIFSLGYLWCALKAAYSSNMRFISTQLLTYICTVCMFLSLCTYLFKYIHTNIN